MYVCLEEEFCDDSELCFPLKVNRYLFSIYIRIWIHYLIYFSSFPLFSNLSLFMFRTGREETIFLLWNSDVMQNRLCLLKEPSVDISIKNQSDIALVVIKFPIKLWVSIPHMRRLSVCLYGKGCIGKYRFSINRLHVLFFIYYTAFQ